MAEPSGEGAGTVPLEAGVSGGQGGWAAPPVSIPAPALLPPAQAGADPRQPRPQQAPGSPCRRFWSESERKAGRGPPLRKIMASRPRKSAVRPVYSSPPGVGGAESGEEGSRHPFPRTSAGSHPPCAHPALSITHLRRCWRRDGWAHAGTAPAHSQHCGPPGEVRAGEREAGCHWESSTSPPPHTHTRAVAIMHRVQLESGGGGVKPPSIQGLASGVSSGTKAPFRPLKPLPRPRLHGEGSGA